MTNHLPMIPPDEDSKLDKTKKPLSVWQRSWTIKLIKHELFPVVFTVFGVILACAIVYVAVKSEQWWTKQIFISKVNIVKVAKAAEVTESEVAKMGVEDYIRYKFGKHARMALAISQAENGTRQCDRMNWNTNKTVDFGVFMINTVHLKKGYSISDLTDCHTNIDIAYDLFKAQGWGPWVVYNTGAYKKFLK